MGFRTKIDRLPFRTWAACSVSRPNQPAEPDNHQHSVNISQPPIPAVLRRLIALSCTKVAGRFMLCSFTLCQLPASQLLYVPASLCPRFSMSPFLCVPASLCPIRWKISGFAVFSHFVFRKPVVLQHQRKYCSTERWREVPRGGEKKLCKPDACQKKVETNENNSVMYRGVACVSRRCINALTGRERRRPVV